MSCTADKEKSARRKPYSQPTLVNGPTLALVTADVAVSLPTLCWVARAAFGETDLRWMIFRAWLIENGPAWFRRLYIQYGETVGAWLRVRPRGRALVRAMMMPAIRSKVR
jgi:hypothetical protein